METDYKKKYDEALAKARAGKGLEEIFPELKESEDERIRRHLIDIVETYWGTTNDPGKAADIAWLEKQKESLHITEMCKENAGSFTDEDEDRTINGCLLAANAERRCKRASEELLEELGLADYTKFFYEQGVEKGKKEREKKKEQKPKQEAPADTETLTAKLVNLLKSYRIGEETATTLANRIADTYGTQRYLDGLCDGKKDEWKPSEEQMDALRVYLYHPQYINNSEDTRIKLVESLYNDLKKLM